MGVDQDQLAAGPQRRLAPSASTRPRRRSSTAPRSWRTRDRNGPPATGRWRSSRPRSSRSSTPQRCASRGRLGQRTGREVEPSDPGAAASQRDRVKADVALDVEHVEPLDGVHRRPERRVLLGRQRVAPGDQRRGVVVGVLAVQRRQRVPAGAVERSRALPIDRRRHRAGNVSVGALVHRVIVGRCDAAGAIATIRSASAGAGRPSAAVSQPARVAGRGVGASSNDERLSPSSARADERPCLPPGPGRNPAADDADRVRGPRVKPALRAGLERVKPRSGSLSGSNLPRTPGRGLHPGFGPGPTRRHGIRAAPTPDRPRRPARPRGRPAAYRARPGVLSPPRATGSRCPRGQARPAAASRRANGHARADQAVRPAPRLTSACPSRAP